MKHHIYQDLEAEALYNTVATQFAKYKAQAQTAAGEMINSAAHVSLDLPPRRPCHDVINMRVPMPPRQHQDESGLVLLQRPFSLE